MEGRGCRCSLAILCETISLQSSRPNMEEHETECPVPWWGISSESCRPLACDYTWSLPSPPESESKITRSKETLHVAPRHSCDRGLSEDLAPFPPQGGGRVEPPCTWAPGAGGVAPVSLNSGSTR